MIGSSAGFKSAFLSNVHWRQVLVSTTTLLWCTRLGSFLSYRVYKDKKDSRFDAIKIDPLKFGVAWFMQGVWVFLTAYPVYFLNVTPAAQLAKFALWDGLGLGLWISGFAMEAVADWQKLQWAQKLGEEERKKQFIDVGLWFYSRHPNYAGELLLWTGSFIMCASGLRHNPLRALSFIVSPLLVTALLYKVSGIPLLEKSSDKKFGHLDSYQEYKRTTPVLMPNFLKKAVKSE